MKTASTKQNNVCSEVHTSTFKLMLIKKHLSKAVAIDIYQIRLWCFYIYIYM